MALSKSDALQQARVLREIRQGSADRLDQIRRYLRDDPEDRFLGGIPEGAPPDVIRQAKISRVNVLKYVVNSRVQGMYIDGYQNPGQAKNVLAWDTWQRNGMDARQIGINRATQSYGTAYIVALQGDPVPVMRGASPRNLTAVYDEDGDLWPRVALEKRSGNRWRLLDDEFVHPLRLDNDAFDTDGDPWEHGGRFEGDPVCPVVRVRETDDLDDLPRGIVEPHIPIQDQINVTTFGLMVAQHYGAFRQRYIIGWLAESEKQALRVGASRLMQFEDSSQDVQVGEFAQTELRGYLESRKDLFRLLAVVSQTPVSDLVGEFVNVGADALEAMRHSRDAALEENRMVAGEAYEQALNLTDEMQGRKPDPTATVLWRDTRVRSLEQAAKALGELTEKLGVPAKELWSRIPGIPQHEIDQWLARS